MKNSSPIAVYAFDRLVQGYSIVMILLLVLLGRPLGSYLDEIVFYLGTAVIAFIVPRYVDETRSRGHAFIRILYPVILFTFFYRATGGTMFLLFDQFLDPQLTAFEKAFFGVNPTLYIDRHLLNEWITEILSICYFAYYPMIPVYALVLFFRKDYAVLKSSVAAFCLAFFVSYALFFLYPIEGPRYHFVNEFVNAVTSPFARNLIDIVMAKGAVHGGCMPSSHFGVALVILMYCFRYYRRAAWMLLPIVIGLALGTFWGRFHYVSDVIVGGLIGAISVLLIWRYEPVDPGAVKSAPPKQEIPA